MPLSQLKFASNECNKEYYNLKSNLCSLYKSAPTTGQNRSHEFGLFVTNWQDCAVMSVSLFLDLIMAEFKRFLSSLYSSESCHLSVQIIKAKSFTSQVAHGAGTYLRFM